MDAPKRCPECGADWPSGQTCADHFHTLLAWEWEHQLLDVHHLLVLCYHVQHPRLYSPDGLRCAQGLLVGFVEQGIPPQQMRQRMGKEVDSGSRQFRIKGTPDSHGAYAFPVEWTMTAGDVVAAGVGLYYESVRAWAAGVLQSLRESGNLV
jgi:hypothetical protein